MRTTKTPRGIRNNNPGNIRISASNWRGKVPVVKNTDGSFEQFIDMKHGVRALLLLLYNYRRKHNLDTVQKIVSRFAPASENHTDKYVKFVSEKMEVQPQERLVHWQKKETSAQELALARFIILYETGQDILTKDIYLEAKELL